MFFLPSIVISFLVANTIYIIIKLIFLTDRNIVQAKRQVSYIAAENCATNVRRSIVTKHVLFFIFGLIFILIFWMMLSSFSAVFHNSQIILLECVAISFGIALVYPFFYNIIPYIFRFCALSCKNMECIYNFSKFLQVL